MYDHRKLILARNRSEAGCIGCIALSVCVGLLCVFNVCVFVVCIQCVHVGSDWRV